MTARSAASFAAAALAVVATTLAAQEDPAKPVSEVSVGLGYVDSDGRRFGQYSGMNEKGGYGLLDLYINRRDDATGTWTQLWGRNLGLDSRQLRFEHNRQGNWGYYLEYGRTPRYEPHVITTGVGGIGTNNLVVPPAGTMGSPYDLKTRRDVYGLGFDKFFAGTWDLKVRFRQEEKEGARIFGRGNGGDIEFTPEPIDSTTRQLDVILGYTGDKLQLSGGFYGTMYNNKHTQLNIAGGAAGLATFTPIGLPPDNSSYQLNLAGGYSFTPTTRGSFKFAHARAKQDDGFMTGVVLAPGITNSNLEGKVDTTLAQAGIVSRPMPKLTLRADLRYEDRDDKTPVRIYFAPPGTTTDGTNEPRSWRSIKGLAEASYMLPYQIRLTGGIDGEERKRNTSAVRVVSFRETTEEMAYRVELRRSMSETLTGAISYVYSDRDGSPFQTTTVTAGTPGSNLIAPLHLADRKRDKVRFSSNWTPLEPLNIQFFVDYSNDKYSGRDGSGLGPRSGRAENYSVDASYRFSDKWQGNVWFNYNDTKAEQVTCEAAVAVTGCPATAADPVYRANLRNQSESFGVGLRGQPSVQWGVGADLVYSNIKDKYGQSAVSPTTSTVPQPLPDVSTRLTRFTLFTKYALQKNSGLRFEYIYDSYRSNDWTWTTFTYTDGTTVRERPKENVNYLGVSYFYRFQ
jgi:MtrB/PioB family decaheme-associated outer membrane protein